MSNFHPCMMKWTIFALTWYNICNNCASGIPPLLSGTTLSGIILIFHRMTVSFVSEIPLFVRSTKKEIIFGMKTYISQIFFNPKGRKLWLNSACSLAIQPRKAALKRFRSYPSPQTHLFHISAENHTKLVLQLPKTLSWNVQTFSRTNSRRDFGASPTISPAMLLNFSSCVSSRLSNCHLMSF